MTSSDTAFEYDAATRVFTWVRNGRRIRISGVDEDRAVKLLTRYRKHAAERARGESAFNPFSFTR